MNWGNNNFQQLAESFGERKFVYIVFCDVSDSTELAKKLEPEIYGLIMYQLEQCVRNVLKDKSFGGEYVKSLGDGFLAAFGYSEIKENQAYQVLKAILIIQQEIDVFITENALQDLHLSVHIGVHAGTCIITNIQDGHRDYLGDPVNIAKKICDFAEAGEIAISETAFGRARDKFLTSTSQAIKIPGQSTKFVVSKVVGEKSLTENFLEQRGSFSGRGKEMTWLKDMLISKSKSQIVMLQSEAGLGKSRLIREFSSQLAHEGFSIHLGQCEAEFVNRTYKVFDQIIYSIFKSEYGMTPAAALRLSSALPEPILDLAQLIDSRLQNKENISVSTNDFEKIVFEAFKIISEHNLIIIDDWQWVDNASQQIIETLLKADLGHIKIILATRQRDAVFEEMNNVAVLELKPLGNDEIEELVSSLLPGYDPFVLEHMIDYSGGNPLYLEELCHGYRDTPLEVEELSGGAWLTALINARFEKLPDHLSKIIKTSTVIGHLIPEWILRDILETDIDSEKLEALRKADFIYPSETPGQLRFKHAITREVLYQQVGLKERVELHTKVISCLHNNAAKNDETEPYDQLAYHYGQSGNAAKAIHYSKIAGDEALKISALDRAQSHFRNALEFSEKIGIPLKSQLPYVKKFGLASVSDPAKQQTSLLQLLSQQASHQEDPETIAWTEYWFGNHLYGLGVPRESVAHLHTAYEKAVEIKNEKLSNQIIANLGQGYASACEYEKALKYLDQAIDLKQNNDKRKIRKGGLVYALSCKGFLLGEQGHYHEAEACFGEAAEILGEDYPQIMTSIYAQQGCSNLWNGESERAHDLVKKGMELAHGIHARYNYCQCVFMDALLNYQKTGLSQYLDKMIEATNWLWLEGIGQNLSLNFTNIAECFVKLKDWPNARKYIAGALLRARKGDRRCESQAYCVLATLAMAGQANYKPQTYIDLAYQSAHARKSVRELKNTQQFEQEFC